VARIAGVNVPDNKKVWVALTRIHGIGRTTAKKVCVQAGIDYEHKMKDLDEGQIGKLREVINANCTVEGDLRKQVAMNIQSLISMKSYRGLRHRLKLPIKGRTRSNARVRKGRKAVPIAGKKKVTK